MNENKTAPKKLLIIIGALNMGGAEHMVYELVKFINKEEYTPEILCYGKPLGNSLEAAVSGVCKVRYVGISGKIGFGAMRRVFAAIKEASPDVIHAHLGGVTFAMPWCFLHRVPLCITVHSRPDRAFSSQNRRMLKLLKGFLKLKVIAVSKENLSLVRDYYRLSEKKCGFINNGIDVGRFYRAEHGKFTFINVARQDENKNQIAIIRAIYELKMTGKDVKLLLVGDGPESESLKKATEELRISDSVEFTGLVSDPSKYYAQSDVYVQASFREALPLSVLEAMAAGLPIIATDVGGLCDVVTDNGILVKAGDGRALFSAMKRIMDSTDAEYTLMSESSKSTVNGYSSVRMAELYEQVYKEISNGRVGAEVVG